MVAPYVDASELAAFRRLLTGGPRAAVSWRRQLRHGGLLYFAGLTGDAAQRLLEVLPADELEGRQNDAPTVRTFLEAAVRHPGRVELIGYCVGPDRDDERFSVEGAVVDLDGNYYVQRFDPWAALPAEHEARCQCEEVWSAIEEQHGLTGATCPPTEIGEFWAAWHQPPRPTWRVWWT